MAVQGQGLAREVREPAEFGPAGRRHLRGEDPPVQEPPADFIQAIAVPHQAQGRLPGITPGQEKAEIRCGVLEIGPRCSHSQYSLIGPGAESLLIQPWLWRQVVESPGVKQALANGPGKKLEAGQDAGQPGETRGLRDGQARQVRIVHPALDDPDIRVGVFKDSGFRPGTPPLHW